MADGSRGAGFLDALPRLKPAKAYVDAVGTLWAEGLPSGEKTGWLSVDKLYTVVPGQMTILTGWPGSGKSEWLDALLVNLARKGWKFAVFSFENQPVELHAAKLLEKFSGKPFGRGPTDRMSADEVREYMDTVDQCFAFAEVSEDALAMRDVLRMADEYLSRFPEDHRGLVIDPWNELEHWRPQGMSETEYVSHTLSAVRNWARKNRVHVWIVAHPQKMRRDEGKLPIPKPDMISGSQHWWNKADCAVTVYRDLENFDSQMVSIIVQKVRFKHVGRVGMTELRYDKVTGRYHDDKVSHMDDYKQRTAEQGAVSAVDLGF